jgi:large subunit ribosomal protein L24
MKKIKKGDTVVVISGSNKGSNGRILSISPAKCKAKIEGVRLIKKAIKPNPQLGKAGGFIEKEAWVDISNVAILNPITKKADKVKIATLDNGTMVRKFKSNGELIDIK